jgi:hypothetical protein
MWILAVFALFVPRAVAFLLYFFSNWFIGVFATWYWPLLGFIFAPYTMLWYSVVANWYGGEWGTLQLVVLAIAVLFDLGSGGKSAKG